VKPVVKGPDMSRSELRQDGAGLSAGPITSSARRLALTAKVLDLLGRHEAHYGVQTMAGSGGLRDGFVVPQERIATCMSCAHWDLPHKLRQRGGVSEPAQASRRTRRGRRSLIRPNPAPPKGPRGRLRQPRRVASTAFRQRRTVGSRGGSTSSKGAANDDGRCSAHAPTTLLVFSNTHAEVRTNEANHPSS